MDIILDINKATCIRCGKCAKVCPSLILRQETSDKEIELHNVKNCILCGHCVAACPNGSVIHSEFPPEKVHPIKRDLLPAPEQVMLLCKSRRSNRACSSEPIPEDYLDMIVEAAHRAPTASNLQQVEYTMVTNSAKLNEVVDITIEIFISLVNKLSSPLVKPMLKKFAPGIHNQIPRFRQMQEARKSGKDPILRGFTTLILIHTPKDSRFGCQDANLAYQNGSLMAESLGVAQFYTGFLCTATKLDKSRQIENMLGIKGTIQAGMALAIPSFKFPNYIDKKEIKVTKIT